MEKGKDHQTQDQSLLRKSPASTSTDDRSDDKKSFFSWVFLDQSNIWHAGLSWSIFSLLAIAVPILSHFVYHCSTCDRNHRRPFDSIVQLSLSVLSLISFISLSSFSRNYGLRRFLFLDKLSGVSDQVQRGYVRQVHRSMRLLCAFVLPCFVVDCMYKIWWFTSGRNQIPYFINAYLSSTVACFLMLSSWLYRTSVFFLECILFRLICHLQILRLEDFAQVFHKESDVGLILIEHLTIRRNLRIISHRFRAFILFTLILVMASQFASLLVTLKKSSEFNIFNGGELVTSMRILCAFVLPCFAADCIYKIWWFTSGLNQIPYFINAYLGSTVACIFLLSSWLYRTSIFILVCVLFRLICYLQILRLEDFAQVFHKESDVGLILLEHLTVRKNLRIISHRFRIFILLTLILVTASQFASLLVTLEAGSEVNVFNAGELALTSMTLVAGLFICLRSAAKITHRAHAITCLAAKWHACSTINSFDDVEDDIPRAHIVPPRMDYINGHWESDHEEGDEDDIDNTNMMPIFTHTMSYQKRQALVTYFENNKAGITVFGFMLDRTSLHTIIAIQMSLTLWLLNKTIGI